MSLKQRKPVVDQTTGLLKIDVLAGNIDKQDTNPNLTDLQASRIRERFAVSWPVARLTAELYFGEAAI